MKYLLIMCTVLCGLLACSNEVGVMGSSVENSETEIRAALCELENGNFKAAQTMLEAVLKNDPRNIFALRLLPGVAARQIKKDDKSPENIGQIRRTIDAYENAAANPAFTSELESINDFIVTLYGLIGGDEKTTALLKKAENESADPKRRAAFYIVLAADQYICANDISDAAPVKTTVKQAGREIYVFRKPQNPADFERLVKCAAKGSELIAKAVALDPASDTAWSYRASLSAQLARIAEMEGKPAEKARLMKEYETARTKFFDLSKKRRDEQEKIDREKLAKSSSDDQNFAPTESQLKEYAQELKSYRAERPLAEAVDRVYIPFESVGLVEPLLSEDDVKTEPARQADEKQIRDWKTFSPGGGGFSAELPDNANFSSSGDSRIYTASGGGLSFFILENTRTVELTENEQDAALNILAWTLTKYVGSSYLSGGGWNDRFESELTRKDKLSDRPARFYAYRLISCRENKDGTMIFVIGKKKNYAMDIRGAKESDARIQKFVKSLKLD
ncbi:MAG TPA: hypothetical protein VNB22_16425 [Pyrinomonadaceae bacterium]|nr:hypothetical protein [Pyrinomonadaceae bacterium]